MGNAAIKLEVETYFLAQWELVNPTVPVAHGNMVYIPTEDQPWIQLLVQPANPLVDEIFSKKRQYVGIVSVSVFIPLQSGTSVSDKLLDDASDIFINADLGVEFRDINIVEVGEDEKHFYRFNLFVDYVDNH